MRICLIAQRRNWLDFQLSQQIPDVISRDGVGNTARFLNHGFFAFLDENFVDYADDVAADRVVKRTATIAGVCCGIELEDIVDRAQ